MLNKFPTRAPVPDPLAIALSIFRRHDGGRAQILESVRDPAHLSAECFTKQVFLVGRSWSSFSVSPRCSRQGILQGFPHTALLQVFGIHKGSDSVMSANRCDSAPRLLFLKECTQRKAPRRQSMLCSWKTKGGGHEGPDLLSTALVPS